MNSTPLWVPLVVAGLGLVGAVLGTVTGIKITARESARRDDLRWRLERERDELAANREDSSRWLSEKRLVYANFLRLLENTDRMVWNIPRREEDNEVRHEAINSVVDRFDDELRYAQAEVELIGSAAVRANVDMVLEELFALAYAQGGFHNEHDAWKEKKTGLVEEMRFDTRSAE